MRNSNKVMALAAAVIAVSMGHSFNFWYNTDPIAQAQHVDAKHVWELAQFKVIAKKHKATEPDPEPTRPKGGMPIPMIPQPSVSFLNSIAA